MFLFFSLCMMYMHICIRVCLHVCVHMCVWVCAHMHGYGGWSPTLGVLLEYLPLIKAAGLTHSGSSPRPACIGIWRHQLQAQCFPKIIVISMFSDLPFEKVFCVSLYFLFPLETGVNIISSLAHHNNVEYFFPCISSITHF